MVEKLMITMSNYVGERWVLRKPFDGTPKLSDFNLVKEDLGKLHEGEIIYESEYLSVDPWQKLFAGFAKVQTSYSQA